ncbi:MAG: Ig-like domain-containing protein [Dysgonamonadaceae bacterium]
MNRFLYLASFIFAALFMLSACSDGPERDVEYTIYTTQSTIELIEGEEYQITASPTTQTFRWESSDAAVATVSSTGLVRAISDGACFINSTSSEGLKKSIPVDVIKSLPLEGIEVAYKSNLTSLDNLPILMGKTTALVASAIPSNYNEKIAFNLIWESSDENIVTVDENGVVTPVYYGNAEITVSVADKPSAKKVIPVEVLENSITAINVESSLVMTLNNKQSVVPVILPSDYAVRDSSLVWKSSDESIVKVKDGEIEPVGIGSAIVTVSLNSNPSVNSEIAILVGLNPHILNRTNWEIIDWNSCISEEPQYVFLNRIPQKMLDGNTTTFWGSKWDAPKPLPYYFIFDMKSEYKVYQISFTKPTNDSWRGNIKNGHFEISNNNVTWTKLSDWSVSNNTPRTHTFTQDGSSARYVKFVISDVFVYSKPAVGPAGGAQCDIAEFNVLGEE